MRNYNDSLKWIFFIPLSVLMYLFGYILIRIVIATFVMFFFPTFPIPEGINPDYEGHYIYASISCFLKDGLPIGFAVFFGAYLIPTHKKRIFNVFVCIWLVYILYHFYSLKMNYNDISNISFLLSIFSLIGQLTSIILAGYVLKRIRVPEAGNYL
ncbi:MAG: hypothetical protein Q8904_03575 [Bacteroidota bacterium]|nr:hypothetical protein [Bacteroidota bacterium]